MNLPKQEGRIGWLTRLVYSSPFEFFIAFVILVNATSLAILTLPDLDASVKDACEQIDLMDVVPKISLKRDGTYLTLLSSQFRRYLQDRLSFCDYLDYSDFLESSAFSLKSAF